MLFIIIKYSASVDQERNFNKCIIQFYVQSWKVTHMFAKSEPWNNVITIIKCLTSCMVIIPACILIFEECTFLLIEKDSGSCELSCDAILHRMRIQSGNHVFKTSKLVLGI